MANSLLSITPHEVSRDLSGYSVLLYGEPKSGKTTTACKFPKSLLLAFERGYNAIPGVMAKPINSWAEFKKVLIELKDPEVQQAFKTIIIDTADIAYGFCEEYICKAEDKDSIGDIPYGKGYKLVSDEFDTCIRKILQMNYGLVLISHSTDKVIKNENGEEYNRITPTLDNRGKLICERTCDIIGYSRAVETPEGKSTRLYLRGTPRFVAGSRFKYVPDFIEFSYDNLVNAIMDAIDKEAAENNNKFVTEKQSNLHTQEVKVYNFEELTQKFQSIVEKLMSGDKAQENSNKIVTIVETHLGKGKKVSECTPSQAELLDLIVYDLEHLL